MGRDHNLIAVSANNKVSIHAPAWGATKLAYTVSTVGQFQSTRPHGARPTRAASAVTSLVFQSTRPHGARPDQLASSETG